MMLENLQLERVGVKDAFSRLTIDANAVVITPYQRAANILTEMARGQHAHGTCGVGLGQARADSIKHSDYILRAHHLKSKDETMKRLKFIEELHTPRISAARHLIAHKTGERASEDPVVKEAISWFNGGDSREYLWSQYENFPLHVILPNEKWTLRDILLRMDEIVIFEGSQGVLLDEDNQDFYPHVTYTDTTYRNAIDLIGKATAGRSAATIPTITAFGCLRPYATRHGAGPLPREDKSVNLTQDLREATKLTEHNEANRFQGSFRYAYLDLVWVKRAINYMGAFGGVDQIAMSCMDHLFHTEAGYFDLNGKFHESPSYNPSKQDEFADAIQKLIGVPISVLGYGPAYTHRFLRLTN